MVQVHYHLKKMYILETEINDNKLIHVALTSVLGINFFLLQKICKFLGLNKNLKIKNLTKKQKNSLFIVTRYLKIKINYNLKRYEKENYNKLMSINNYKKFRKLNRLPVRGQRTHTNAKTCKKLK